MKAEDPETGESHLKPYPQIVEDSYKAGMEDMFNSLSWEITRYYTYDSFIR